MLREPEWSELTQEEIDGFGWGRRDALGDWWYRNMGAVVSVSAFVGSLLILGAMWWWQVGTITEARVREAASNAGINDVDVGEFTYWQCSDSDGGGYEITGTVADGRRVDAVVCCGAWKRCTVRW